MRLLPILLLFLGLISCRETGPNIEEILDADRNFSLLSASQGVNKAFLEYADDSAVLLRENSYPIVGKQALEKIFNKNDSSYTLTWEPSYGFIAQSNDLGYTYGIYTFQLPDTLLKGTYVSIWKRNKQGWKYVLDSGNEGIENPDRGS